MIISLDRNALKSLIDADPEFELSLKNAVITEVGRRFFEKDSQRVIRAADTELFDQVVRALHSEEALTFKVSQALDAALVARTKNFPHHSVRLSDDTKKELEYRVANLKESILQKASNDISGAYSTLVQKAVDAKIADQDIDGRVERRVKRLTEQEINRRVDARFAERLAELSRIAAQ